MVFLSRGRNIWEAAGFWVLDTSVATLLFVFLCSGMSSSNTGTYLRSREPVRFWAEIGLLGAAYIALSCAGLFG